MHTVVYMNSKMTVYFPNTCSWWYCEWLIGACYFNVKHLYIWNFVWLYFFRGTLKGIFFRELKLRLSGLQKFDLTHVL